MTFAVSYFVRRSVRGYPECLRPLLCLDRGTAQRRVRATQQRIARPPVGG